MELSSISITSGGSFSAYFNDDDMLQSTGSGYLDMMQRAGLLESARFGKWTYYRRNEDKIKEPAKVYGRIPEQKQEMINRLQAAYDSYGEKGLRNIRTSLKRI